MATERSPIKRAFEAALRATNLYLFIPLLGVIAWLCFVPREVSTDGQAAALNFVWVCLALSSLLCSIILLAQAAWAGCGEYRYGAAMRRTGLSRQQLSRLIYEVPYEMVNRWRFTARMLEQWSAEDFLDFYKETALKQAREALAYETVNCFIFATSAQHGKKAFDDDAFMDKAEQKFRDERRRIYALTAIPG